MERPATLDQSTSPRHACTIVSEDPVLIAYTVKRSKNGRASWTRIGLAYPHESGAGLTVLLDATPPDGRIILLEPDDEDHARLTRSARKSKPTR